jgi:hypothetical protein
MSVRLRSVFGAVLVGMGGIAALVGAFYVGAWLFWSGVGAAACGFVLVCWAIRDAMLQIADSRAQFDNMLRAQHSLKGRDKPPKGS